MTQICAWEMY